MGKKINIKDLGARENTLCTKEIQKAVDLIDEAGGGTVIIPSGVYLSGTITFMDTIGSRRTGDASINPFLNASIVAILNAISEESTG